MHLIKQLNIQGKTCLSNIIGIICLNYNYYDRMNVEQTEDFVVCINIWQPQSHLGLIAKKNCSPVHLVCDDNCSLSATATVLSALAIHKRTD